MESHGIAFAVQVTEATYKRLRRCAFQRRGIIHVKGKGALYAYFLVGRRPQKSRPAASRANVKPAVIVTRYSSSVDLSKPITMDVPARVPIIDDD